MLILLLNIRSVIKKSCVMYITEGERRPLLRYCI